MRPPLVIVVVVVGAVIALAIVLSHHASSTGGSSPTTVVGPSTSVPTSATQTHEKPSMSSASLTQWFTPLWGSISSNDPLEGLGDTVPEPVYAVLEAGRVEDAVAAYVSVIQAPFQLDVESYHAVVGDQSRLVAVRADGVATWTPASSCDTTAGYWLLPAVTVTYIAGGRTSTVLVADLVSWRGSWYVGRFGSTSDVAGGNAVLTDGSRLGSVACPIAT
jgi:hypothetical protein